MNEETHNQARWRRTARLPAVLVALTLVGLVASACSSGPGTPSVAGLTGTTTTVLSGGGSLQSQGDQDMVNFARCMRSHGVQMSDPVHVPGHAGLSFTDLPLRASLPSPRTVPATTSSKPSKKRRVRVQRRWRRRTSKHSRTTPAVCAATTSTCSTRIHKAP